MTGETRRGTGRHRSIVLAVTVDLSLGLIDGFAHYLVESGWDVRVVSGPGAYADRLRDSGIQLHEIKMSREPDPVRDLRSLLAWIRILREIRPDVIVAGTPKAGLLGTIAAWITRVPDRVYIVRGLRLETSTGVLRQVLTVLEKLTFALSTRALSVGPSLRDEILRLKLTRPSKVWVLGKGSSNGVDIMRFVPRPVPDETSDSLRESLGLDPALPTIGFVGRLNRDKGLDTLREALHLIAAGPIRLQLLLVGGQDGGVLSDQEHVGGNVRIVRTGQVLDTSAYYPLLDVFCLPTRREGFPNVVLEAAASGVPTITTDATGAVDSVVDGVTGLIVKTDDPSALAEAILQLLSDDELRARMGENARRWVVDDFDQATVWNRTIDFLMKNRAS
ncbi:glycosyltransferase family 4 protein [Microbacterium suwonense]|uniref:D-inositol 3-phosphate glycosyltransferase n=1 Tax=Microbacterium suwonense TaxID=683047 RepID=A0ABN6X3D1_9MICO|nr:glycosyltransferase family 4 protein [Microbacterium suwonense]BDZ39229.1 hypothetical protein GCM10025863_18430 [Microbacterium suwonense]